MHDAHEFLKSLTIVLVVAAVITVLFQRVRMPVVLGYIAAGLIVGPYVPVPLVADREIVQTLSELGVILLMFSLGLEFRLGKLAKSGPAAGVTAVLQSGIMAWLGFLTGRLFGWTTLESVFMGAAIAISSTTIIAKVFDDQRVGGALRERVVGVLLIEDLIAIVFMAALTAVATGAGLSAGALGMVIGRLVLFLTAILVAGMLVVPVFVRWVQRIGRAETTVVASVGVCFGTAFAAQQAGYSVALGAFLAGSLVAESGHASEVEHGIQPIRDLFAAIFFVSVGMLIEPALVAEYWVAIVVLTLVVIAGKVVSVALGAFLTGSGVQTAVQSGMSLAQIGEFSFIIVALGLQLGATRPFLYPVVVAVSAITTLTTPWLIRAAPAVAAFVDRSLPGPLQTFATLHAAWIERLRTGTSARRPARMGRIIRLLVLDVVVLGALIITAAALYGRATGALQTNLGLAPGAARFLFVAVVASASMPFVIGVARLSMRLGRSLAESAIPQGARAVDLDAAPRRTLALALEIGVALAAGVVLLAITQPFLPSYAGPVLLALLAIGYGFALWRRATDLEGHVRAGSMAVAQALSRHARAGAGGGNAEPLADVHSMLPGLGHPVVMRLGPMHPAVGQSLSDLHVRGRTGAAVLAIQREGQSIVAPGGSERLLAGDIVALTGTHEAIEAARLLLLGPERS